MKNKYINRVEYWEVLQYEVLHSVKMKYAGEMYTISRPYDSFEEAEDDLDIQQDIWGDNLEDEDEYIGIVFHKDE